jgi:pimeloyl-ACP methyl ester carboxylesterase
MPFRNGWIARPVLSVVLAACVRLPVLAASPATTRPTAAQRVNIEAEDGVLVVADYYPPAPRSGEAAPIAILLHMERSDRSAWRPLAPYLHAAGFAVLAIDLRGHGESIEPKGFNLARKAADRDSRLFRAMYKDVTAAYLWLASRNGIDASRFALVGAGIGGGVAMDYASRDKSVDAIVCVSPGVTYPGLDTVACIRKCDTRAVLLLAAKSDSDGAAELQRAAGKATLKLLPDAGSGPDSPSPRGTDLLGKTKDPEKAITTFLERAVGRSATDPVVASIESEVYHVPGTSHAQRIKDENRRWFSSATEAEARGLRPVKKRASKSTAGQARQASPKAASPRSRRQP